MPPDRLIPGRAVESLHLVPRVLDLPEHGADLTGGENPLEGRHVRPLQIGQDRLLGEVAEVPAAQHRPGPGNGVSDESPYQGRLAGPVSADQADLVAWLHAERRLFEEEAGAKFDSEISDDEHFRSGFDVGGGGHNDNSHEIALRSGSIEDQGSP